MKSNSNHATKRGISGRLIAVLFLVPIVAFIGFIVYKKRAKDENARIKSSIYDLMAVEVNRSRAIDKWWMLTDLSPTIQTSALLESKKAQIMGLLQVHKDISPETRRLFDRFSEVKVGAYIGGKFSYLAADGVSQAPKGREIGLCFFAEDISRKTLITHPMWRPDEGIVVLPAHEFPPKLLVAAVFHELGHAIRHNAFDGDITPATLDDPVGRIREEIAMHEFGGSILNHLSEGKYYKILDQIVARSLKEKRFDKILASITFKEREDLLDMFECQNSEAGRGLLMSNAVILIGGRLCDLKGKGEKERMQIFQWTVTDGSAAIPTL